MLADGGARVIKVEEPSGGDETRRWGPPFVDDGRGDFSTYFLSVNRNKESVAVDLRSDEGRAFARALIEQADVVIDNFLPAQRERLLEVPETKIHCSITGFDGDTPEAHTPGYDLLAQAGSGLMSITGAADGEPAKIGVALADVLTAHYAHGAICAALVDRVRTGRGARLGRW
jgi:crotonobetainyl-CoA:carnitine CoA-transferase CaiB-like acyl-CoA transferase